MSEWRWYRGDWNPGAESPPPEVAGGPVIHLVLDGASSANTLSRATLDDLDRALDELEPAADVEALVLSSAKEGHFVAGAEIDGIASIADPTEATTLAARAQSVFGRLGKLPFPSFAAIRGTCLGGGLELALGCRYRIAIDDPTTKIGLPEVNLGIIPGFGGSQRLPRLIGVAKSLPLILAGSRLPAAVAYRRGVVDAVVPPEGGLQVALRAIEKIVRTGGRAVEARRKKVRGGWKGALWESAPGRALLARGARKQVLAKTGGHYPAPLAAIDLVTQVTKRPVAEGLAREAEVVGELAVSPVCKNLIGIFLASERARKMNGPAEEGGAWPKGGQLGVLGAGVMGAGVASAALERGLAVRMRDLEPEPLSRGLAQVAGDVDRLVKKRRKTKLEGEEILSRLTYTTEAIGFGRADAVLEAIVEQMPIKQRALREIEPQLQDDCLFLTNTSALSVTELQSAAERPERVVGLHFFNPVQKMPLVEVIAGEKSASWAVSRTIGLAQALGKFPVVVQDSPGFLVNRVLMPYLDAAVRLLVSGVAGERIDAVARSFGLPMGPLRLIDEVGIDIGIEVAETLHHAFGDRVAPSDRLAALAEKGWLGRKNGTGFYHHGGTLRYNEGVDAIIGATPREASDEEIIAALVDPMVDEAARCLEEGIIADAEAVDLAMVMGTGFPPFRGGLLRHADREGLKKIADRIERAESPRSPCDLLKTLADAGQTFHGADRSSLEAASSS